MDGSTHMEILSAMLQSSHTKVKELISMPFIMSTLTDLINFKVEFQTLQEFNSGLQTKKSINSLTLMSMYLTNVPKEELM